MPKQTSAVIAVNGAAVTAKSFWRDHVPVTGSASK
jgi:hypothetical protein